MKQLEILAYSKTPAGWQMLTNSGSVIEFETAIPKQIALKSGRVLKLPKRRQPRLIERYVAHSEAGVKLMKQTKYEEALEEFKAAVQLVPTARIKFQQAMVKLALGGEHWLSGLQDYESRFELGYYPALERLEKYGVPRWRGENLQGKTLLLVHDEGHGDLIQMLRYVPRLQQMGTKVVLLTSPLMLRLVAGIVDEAFTDWSQGINRIPFDYYSPSVSLWLAQQESQAVIPRGVTIAVKSEWRQKWIDKIGATSRKRRVGIAWSVGVPRIDDFPREIPLGQLMVALAECELHSVQTQGAEDAIMLGIHTHSFDDFADCAGLMSLMDAVVCVDTAALHLAATIGHPDVIALLSHWASWRWNIDPPLYPNMRLLRQAVDGNEWGDTLKQLKWPTH